MKKIKKNKILYVVNSINFLISHRYEVCQSVQDDGDSVLIICGNEELKDEYILQAKNLNFVQINFNRLEKNPIKILASIIKIIKIISEFQPNVVHTVSPLGNLMGGLGSIFFSKIHLISAISGRGTLYIRKNASTKLMKKLFSICEYIYLNKKKSSTITQNSVDYYEVRKKQFSKKNNEIIFGSGVNLSKFYPKSNNKIYDFCFIGRLTEDKGIVDFIKASEIAFDYNKDLKFLILGEMPTENKKLCAELDSHFKQKKYITYNGFSSSLIDYYNSSRYLCLPSKREGMPRVVLEASACGIPSIVYDVVGCNEAIKNNVNGYIVKKLNPNAYADKMIKLSKKQVSNDFIAQCQSYAKERFSIEYVIQAHKKIYRLYN